MIKLRGVSKSYATRTGRKHVLRNVTLHLPDGANIAILGCNGAGKSTFIRLLGGIDYPDRGTLECDRSVSWPLALKGGFQGSMTGRENAKFVCRIYGSDEHDVRQRLQYVHRFSELRGYFDMPIKTYSSGMRARLGFALSMAFQFDIYLIDEVTAVGDERFKKKCARAFNAMRGHSSIIMASHSMKTLRRFCDVAILVGNGKARYFKSVDNAIHAYKGA